jgi:hypothetical protein
MAWVVVETSQNRNQRGWIQCSGQELTLLLALHALGHGTGLNPKEPVAKQWYIAAALDWNEHVTVKNLLYCGDASSVYQMEVFRASTKCRLFRFP